MRDVDIRICVNCSKEWMKSPYPSDFSQVNFKMLNPRAPGAEKDVPSWKFVYGLEEAKTATVGSVGGEESDHRFAGLLNDDKTKCCVISLVQSVV